MKRTVILAVLVAGMFAAGCAPVGPKSSADAKLKVIEAIRPSFVHIEYTMKYDKGEEPRGGSWGSYGQYIQQERPAEASGLLIDDKTVITDDIMMHPRFIKSIAVRDGDSLIGARISGFAVKQDIMYLELEEPLTGAKPAKFDASLPGPYLSVQHSLRGSEWTTSVFDAIPVGSVALTESGEKYTHAPRLMVDMEGRPVGASTVSRVDLEGKWKGSPLDWSRLSSDEMDKKLKAIENITDGGIFRVALNFRSPKKDAGAGAGRYYRGSSDEGEGTEKNAVGLLIDEKTVLVLGNYKPKVTARLKTIAVHPPKAKAPVAAKFAYTLADYGCLVATLSKPLKGVLKFSDKDVRSLRDRLLMSADVTLQGEKRVVYYGHRRVESYSLGWKRNVYPGIRSKRENTFLFDDDGALVIFPLARRPKVSTEERWGGGEVLSTPTTLVKTVLADLAKNADTDNVPLVEQEENRVAWLGVILQPLNRDLARANNVSDLTRDGEIGALVSYVYPDSPAVKAGIQPLWVMLNIHGQGEPKPIDVRAQDYTPRARFPWDRWDKLPPQYWDGKYPTPWQPRETILARKLTDMGFGKKYTATFFTEGKQIKKTFTVVASPKHYHTADKFKSKPVGVTVREMTYEVRRYFLKTTKDPGVIVSAVEPGSKAGVGGVKPYEIITHVNGKPVNGVKEFQAAIKGQTELRLAVQRMIKNRLVKLRM